MKTNNRPQIDLWISGLALLLAMLMLIASGFVCNDSRQGSRDREQHSFNEPNRP